MTANSGFQKLAKIDHLWHFYLTLSTENVIVARFARSKLDIQVFGRKCHDIGRKLNEVEKVQKSPNIH